MPVRREMLSWADVDKLIDHLIPQFETEFDAMLIITRGGIIPGGMLAEAMQIHEVLTASVDFPAEIDREKSKLLAWPKFHQFPADYLLEGRRQGAVSLHGSDEERHQRLVCSERSRTIGGAGGCLNVGQGC